MLSDLGDAGHIEQVAHDIDVAKNSGAAFSPASYFNIGLDSTPVQEALYTQLICNNTGDIVSV